MILYRPIGLKELELIAEAEFKAFPPRLPHQPFFYPVLNFEYAQQIARDWNTKDQVSGFAGFVTKFEVAEHYVQQFDVQVVGHNQRHRELWIPADELETFNRHIIGQITVVAAYYGQKFNKTEKATPPKNRPHPLNPPLPTLGEGEDLLKTPPSPKVGRGGLGG